VLESISQENQLSQLQNNPNQAAASEIETTTTFREARLIDLEFVFHTFFTSIPHVLKL
jgi:hypothetical protein